MQVEVIQPVSRDLGTQRLKQPILIKATTNLTQTIDTPDTRFGGDQDSLNIAPFNAVLLTSTGAFDNALPN